MLLGRALDTRLDLLDLVGIVFGGIIFMMNIGPGRTYVFCRIYRVFLIHRVGKLDIAILALALTRVHVVAPVDAGFFLLFVTAHLLTPLVRNRLQACDLSA